MTAALDRLKPGYDKARSDAGLVHVTWNPTPRIDLARKDLQVVGVPELVELGDQRMDAFPQFA